MSSFLKELKMNPSVSPPPAKSVETVEPERGPPTQNERLLHLKLQRMERENESLRRENHDLRDMMRGVAGQLRAMAGPTLPAPPTSPLWRRPAENPTKSD